MSVGTEVSYAIVLGGALALGILLVAARVPRWAAPSLSRRIAPYVRDIADPLGITPTAGSLVGGARARWEGLLGALWGALGGTDAVERRLARAGWTGGASRFRARQLGWALTGLAVGAVAGVALALGGRGGVAAVLLAPALAVTAAVLCDAHLTRAARRRSARIEEELPTVLEFLALCLAAGEGLREALRRVGDVGSGELTAELQRAVLDSGTGSSLGEALTAVSERLDVPSVARAVEHLVAAIDRGAPLAQVLQEQAADAREDAKRSLIEVAGRKEILMLLPLVFLLLPLSVLFAVFPGIVMLRLGIG